MEGKAEKKKKGSLLGAVVFLAIVLVGVFFLNRYLNTDTAKESGIPQKDMSGSEVVGEWKDIGYMTDGSTFIINEDYISNPEEYKGKIVFKDNGVADVTMHLFDDGDDLMHAGQNSRDIKERKGSWDENEESVDIEYADNNGDFVEKSHLEKMPTLTRWYIKGNTYYDPTEVTPKDLGYSSEYFLVNLEYGRDILGVYAKE